MSVTGSGAILQAPGTIEASGYLAPASTIFQNPWQPNIVDFLTFLANQVQIPSQDLPPTSPYPQFALNQALALVLSQAGPGLLYSLAVYNCATHLLFVITPDQNGQSYFKTARSNSANGFDLIQPSTGLVSATFDQGTGVTLASPDWAKGLTVGQLGFYKTPWGRQYLSYIQSYGPTVVGLT